MRCDEVTRELAAPTGQLDPAELSRHLSSCPRCAAWADQTERFDRLWDATRPAEPSAAAFDQIWSNVTQAAESQADRTILRLPAGRRWARSLTLALLAQAAALLVAGLILWSRSAEPPEGRLAQGPNAPTALVSSGSDEVTPDGAEALPGDLALRSSFEAEPGRTLIIQINNDGVSAENRLPSNVSDTVTVAAEIDILNFMETQSQGSF